MKKVFLILLLQFLLFCNGKSQGQLIFDDSFLHEIYINNMDTTLLDGSKMYQMVNITIDGNPIDSIGIKEKGNISNGVPNLKVPFKIKMNKYVNGKKYDGIKEFTLHNSYDDPTLMREKITYDLNRELGLFSLRAAFTKVYINGKYWGVYTLLEGKEELFKQEFNKRDVDVIESLDFGDMCYISNNPNDYNIDINGGMPYYQLENGNPITAWPLFSTMIDKANNTAISSYLNTITYYLNIQDFFTYQASNVYLMNFDSYIGYRGNQLYAYDTINQLWQIIPWDFNASLNLWNNALGSTASNYSIIPSVISNGCIASKMNSIPLLKTHYLNTMCSLVHDLANASTMIDKIDWMKNQIQSAVHLDWRKVFSNSDFDSQTEYGIFTNSTQQYEGLKTFFTNREAKILQDLANEGFICTNGIENEFNSFQLEVFPNPTTDYLNIFTDKEIEQMVIVDLSGRTIERINKPIFPYSIQHMSLGSYIFKFYNEKGTITKKIFIHK